MNNYFQTTDFITACTLKYHGYPLEYLDSKNGYEFIFVFKRDEKLDVLLDVFHKDQIKIEPKAFFAVEKIMKGRLIEAKRNHNHRNEAR